MEDKNFTITSSASIGDAIGHLVTEKLASALVVSAEGAVMGIFTARDLLKFIKDHNESARRGLEEALKVTKITELMTKREKLVYCSPDDTVRRCREVRPAVRLPASAKPCCVLLVRAPLSLR